MLTPPPRTDRRGAPQESLSVLTRRPEAALLPHLGMPFGDACVLRLSGSSRTQCGGRAAQGAGDGACTVVCCIGHQSWNKWPKAPEMRGGDGKGCLEGSAAMAARTPAPSPPPPLPGWPWFLSQGACRRHSLTRRAPLHASWPAGLGVCCREFGQAGEHGSVYKARGIPPNPHQPLYGTRSQWRWPVGSL